MEEFINVLYVILPWIVILLWIAVPVALIWVVVRYIKKRKSEKK